MLSLCTVRKLLTLYNLCIFISEASYPFCKSIYSFVSQRLGSIFVSSQRFYLDGMCVPGPVARSRSGACLTDVQEVAGSILRSGNIHSWGLAMESFLRSISRGAVVSYWREDIQ